MSSPPQQMAAVPLTPSNSGGQRRAFGRPAAMLFFTTSTWMFLLRSSLRKRVVGVRVQADHVHQQGVVDVLQPLAEIVR